MPCFNKCILRIDILCTSCEIGLRWVPQNPIDNKSTLTQQAVTCTNVDLDLSCHMVSVGHSELRRYKWHMVDQSVAVWRVSVYLEWLYWYETVIYICHLNLFNWIPIPRKGHSITPKTFRRWTRKYFFSKWKKISVLVLIVAVGSVVVLFYFILLQMLFLLCHL